MYPENSCAYYRIILDKPYKTENVKYNPQVPKSLQMITVHGDYREKQTPSIHDDLEMHTSLQL